MKLRARIVSIVMAVAMIVSSMVISASAETTDPTLTVVTDTATVTPGGEVVVTVNMANNPGFVSMRLELNYDNDVFTIATLDDVVDAGILGEAVHHNSAAKCPYILSWQNGAAEENFTVNGDLVSVTFQVAEDAVAGESYEFSVSYDYDNTDIMDFGLGKVSFETVAATVTVEDAGEPDPDPDPEPEPEPDAPAIVISDVNAAAGDEVKFNVGLKNNPGLFMISIDVDYDTDVLEFVSAESANDNYGVTKNDVDNIYILDAEDDVEGDFDILTLTFNVREGVEDGEYEISATCLEACNYAEDELSFAAATGKLVVVNFIAGDVTNDGKVTLLDVARLKKYAAKVAGTVIHGAASDVNNDGKISLLDLARLKKAVAKVPGTVLEKSTAGLPNEMVINNIT